MEYVVQYCSTSEKVVVELGLFRLRNVQFVAERLSATFRFGVFYCISSTDVVLSIQQFE